MEVNKSIPKHDNDITLLVVSCDSYGDLWLPYFYTFFKYWPDCPYPILLGSNEKEYSDPRVKMIKIGPDKDYSSNLLAMLENVKTPWLILWIEDFLLSSKIDTDRILNLVNQAQKNQVGYLKLAANTPWAYTNDKKQEIGPIPKGVKYRSGIGLALWKKETLKRLLTPGESAWQIERFGSHRSNSFIEPFYALSTNTISNPPIKYKNSVIKGSWNLGVLPFLKREGLENCIPNRPKQSLWSFLYIELYLFRLDLYRIMRKYWYE